MTEAGLLIEQWRLAKADVEGVLSFKRVDITDPQVTWNYTNNLRNLSAESCITEQRSFLKSFVERIDVGDSEAKVYYTIPVPPSNMPQETAGVLPFVHHG